MSTLDQLKQDQAAIESMLRARQGVTAETLPIGVRLSLQMYSQILEDANSTLGTLIEFLTPTPDQ